MKNLTKLMLSLWAFGAVSCMSQDIPVVDSWDVELTAPADHPVSVIRGETKYLRPRYLVNGAAANITNVTSVQLWYKPSGLATASWFYVTNGTVIGSGVVQVPWSPACESTWSEYNYNVVAATALGNSLSAAGKLTLRGNVTGSQTTAPPGRVVYVSDSATYITNGGASINGTPIRNGSDTTVTVSSVSWTNVTDVPSVWAGTATDDVARAAIIVESNRAQQAEALLLLGDALRTIQSDTNASILLDGKSAQLVYVLTGDEIYVESATMSDCSALGYYTTDGYNAAGWLYKKTSAPGYEYEVIAPSGLKTEMFYGSNVPSIFEATNEGEARGQISVLGAGSVITNSLLTTVNAEMMLKDTTTKSTAAQNTANAALSNSVNAITNGGFSINGVAASNGAAFALLATNGNGAGITNVNAALLDGYSVEQLIAPSVVYYVWGSLFSGFNTPVSNKLAQLTSPAGQPVWTSTVPNVVNSTNLGYASVATNENARILKTGLWKVHLSCLRTGNAQPRTMRAHLRVYENDGVTVTTNLTSDLTDIPEVAGGHAEFVGAVPTDIIITDGYQRYIQVYFETVSGWGGTETLYVYSQNGELTYIELPSVGVLVEAIDSTARTNAATAQANLTIHTNRTDNPHAVTAAQVGAISTNGGTLTGPLLTTLDHITTPPGDYELPSARWVRGLAMAGTECYFTPTITNGYGNKTTNFALLSETLPASLFTNSIASPVASSTYIVGGICTNLRTAIRSTITIDAWLARVGGTSVSTIPIFGEIYYIYNGTTNHLGDWSVGPLYLTGTTPQNMQWVVAFNEPTVTGAVQIIGYLKTGTVSGPAAGVNIYGGGQYSSHMDVQAASSEYTLTEAAIAAAGGLTNAAAFYPAGNPNGYQTAGEVAGIAAGEAVIAVASILGNPYNYRGSFTGHVVATSGNVLTNAAAFATAAQGTKADTALQPAATNGWETGPHTSFATNAGGAGAGYYAMSNGAWTAFAPGAGGSANAVTNGGATIDGQAVSNGAVITTSGGMSGAAVTNIVIAVGTEQGWSTNTAWTWQGAQVVPVATSAYAIAYGGPAVWNEGSNQFDVLPFSTTNYGTVTGSVTITMASNAYLASVGGTWYCKTITDMTKPGAAPVSYSTIQLTSTSAVLSAWCSTNPADAASDYYAYFSNLVVYSYDRPGMDAYQYTNDAAGIVARVDALPEGNTDTRRVVNAESLATAIAAAKADAAREAWNYTPSGARQPNYSVLTIDKPLVQQQAGIVYMQAGNYFAQSYRGAWDNSVTGSVWRVGPSGRMAFEITSTNIGLAISAFSIVTNTAFFTIETNGVVGTPYIEYSADLVAAQWLIAPGQSMVDNTTNWTASCPTVATMLFFRAISPGGANAINSYYRHVFMAGVSGITAADVGAVSNTAAGIAAAGGLTHAVVKAITTYSSTNPVITLSESANAWNWTPPTNVPLSCTFSGPGAGWAGSGMLRLVRTNNDNSVSWPTNATFFSNGTRTTNPPTLDRYNRFVVDYFDGMWTLGLVSTNSVSL